MKQRIHDKAVAVCPQCQGKARRVFNSVPVIFKGSGFYTEKGKEKSPKEKTKE